MSHKGKHFSVIIDSTTAYIHERRKQIKGRKDIKWLLWSTVSHQQKAIYNKRRLRISAANSRQKNKETETYLNPLPDFITPRRRFINQRRKPIKPRRQAYSENFCNHLPAPFRHIISAYPYKKTCPDTFGDQHVRERSGQAM